MNKITPTSMTSPSFGTLYAEPLIDGLIKKHLSGSEQRRYEDTVDYLDSFSNSQEANIYLEPIIKGRPVITTLSDANQKVINIFASTKEHVGQTTVGKTIKLHDLSTNKVKKIAESLIEDAKAKLNAYKQNLSTEETVNKINSII